jgi:hypothetical protein
VTDQAIVGPAQPGRRARTEVVAAPAGAGSYRTAAFSIRRALVAAVLERAAVQVAMSTPDVADLVPGTDYAASPATIADR